MQGFISILTDNRCKQIYGTLYDSSVQICAGENNANAGACQVKEKNNLIIIKKKIKL